MTVIITLIWLYESFDVLILVLISNFARKANLSNGIFKDETRINPRARKLQQNGHN